MEVHKHPHQVIQKKKWPEYLLELIHFLNSWKFSGLNLQ